jgi:hypothetical protein
LSVTAFERALIRGEWQIDVEVEGTPLSMKPDWGCVCWHSDDDADFVELQLDAGDGVVLSRQLLLSRTDHFLLLADSVSTRQNCPLQVTSRLPLVAGVIPDADRWTREVVLSREGVTARVYPLGLEQERVQRPQGSLQFAGAELVLQQTGHGGALHMPIVIDWSPDRQRCDAQWRGLTVAEDGRRLPSHAASGHRLRVGKHQWLFYRSLQAGATGRSVLGHHTNHETVIAEFTGDGEVNPIVLVDAS